MIEDLLKDLANSNVISSHIKFTQSMIKEAEKLTNSLPDGVRGKVKKVLDSAKKGEINSVQANQQMAKIIKDAD